MALFLRRFPLFANQDALRSAAMRLRGWKMPECEKWDIYDKIKGYVSFCEINFRNAYIGFSFPLVDVISGNFHFVGDCF